MNNLIQIGVVIKAHGILGEVLIKYYAESTELLHGTLFLGRDVESISPISITNIRYNNDKLLIQISGITTRTEAERLRGYFLFIDKNSLPPLSEDEVYRVQLFGFAVYTSQEYIGILEDIQDIAGQEIWYIRSQQGEEVLFPAVEQFIDSMDFHRRVIYITPPVGLIEIYKDTRDT